MKVQVNPVTGAVAVPLADGGSVELCLTWSAITRLLEAFEVDDIGDALAALEDNPARSILKFGAALASRSGNEYTPMEFGELPFEQSTKLLEYVQTAVLQSEFFKAAQVKNNRKARRTTAKKARQPAKSSETTTG